MNRKFEISLKENVIFHLSKGEARIYYKGKTDDKLEKEIILLFEKHGYECWASGRDLEADIRDICFEKKG